MLASIGLPSGMPATSRPPLMQSSIAYSSAMRIGGFVVGSVAPICTIADVQPVGGAGQHRAHQVRARA